MEPALFVELVEWFKGTYSVSLICQCVGVPRATYYRWRKSDFTKTELEKRVLAICDQLKFRVGHRTVKGLLKNEGIQVDRKRQQEAADSVENQGVRQHPPISAGTGHAGPFRSRSRHSAVYDQ